MIQSISPSDSVGPVLGSSKLRYIDNSDNTNPVPCNSYDMGPVLGPFMLRSIVSKDNVSPCQLTYVTLWVLC